MEGAPPRVDDAAELLVALFEEHHRALIRLACLLLDDRGNGEEVVQEAYVRLYDGGLRRLREPEAALAYLRRTVVNLSRSRMRRRLVARKHPEQPLGHHVSAEDQVLLLADERRALDALATLPDRQRECLVLRYYSDLNDPEIADAIEISVGAVKQHIHRGLSTIRSQMGDLR